MMAAKPKKIYANRYEVLEKFEGGNFGKVYLCKDLKPNDAQDRKVLKIIKTQPGEAPDGAEKEAGIICKLVHPGILKHNDHVEIENRLIIVSEYCEGGDLGREIKSCRRENRSFSEKKIQHMTAQLAMALEYIHSHGIIHRDLMPENIFICNNVLKIGDFGISRVFQESFVAHTFGGTIPYMAPEMFSDSGHTSAVDIWALGCLVYEFCTLQKAFGGENIPYKITYGPLPVLSSSEHASTLVSLVKCTLYRDVPTRMSAYRVAQKCIDAGFMADMEDSLKEKYLAKWNESRTVLAQGRRELAEHLDSRKQKRDGIPSTPSAENVSYKPDLESADNDQRVDGIAEGGVSPGTNRVAEDHRYGQGICVVSEVEAEKGFEDDDDYLGLVREKTYVFLALEERIRSIEDLPDSE